MPVGPDWNRLGFCCTVNALHVVSGEVFVHNNNTFLCVFVFRWRKCAGTQAWWLWPSGEWMRCRDEDPQQETQEQSTEELGEDVLLMKMAAGPHTVCPASPRQASILFPCIKAVFPVAATFTVDSLVKLVSTRLLMKR